MINKLILLGITLALYSCEIGENEPIKITTYNIHSTRVDDDGEYHIICTNNSTGILNTLSDVSNIEVSYKYISEPYMTEQFRSSPHYYKRELFLPLNYKIETFDD